MYEIEVFIGGADSLDKYKRCCVTVAAEISGRRYGQPLRFVVSTQNSFQQAQHGTNNSLQHEINEFIMKEAKVVFFVFDDHIGEFSREELKLCLERKNDSSRFFRLAVFVRNFNATACREFNELVGKNDKGTPNVYLTHFNNYNFENKVRTTFDGIETGYKGYCSQKIDSANHDNQKIEPEVVMINLRREKKLTILSFLKIILYPLYPIVSKVKQIVSKHIE